MNEIEKQEVDDILDKMYAHINEHFLRAPNTEEIRGHLVNYIRETLQYILTNYQTWKIRDPFIKDDDISCYYNQYFPSDSIDIIISNNLKEKFKILMEDQF